MGLNEEEGNSMDINSMRYFIAAAEHLNFTKAAHACYITQTAMSAAIAKMEKELGATLFHRSNKKVELTEAGGRHIAEAKALHDKLEDCYRRAMDYGRVDGIKADLLARLLERDRE